PGNNVGFVLNTASIRLPVPVSQGMTITQASTGMGVRGSTVGGSGNYVAYAVTNNVSPTNIVLQIIFVQTNAPAGDKQFETHVRFANGAGGQIPIVEYLDWDIDAVTGLPFTNTVFILDTSATTTNRNLLPNKTVTGNF